MEFEITEREMLDALNRSGYLLESEIAATLANDGFFVESNQVIQDPITGKSREIDLLAEHYQFRQEWADLKCASIIKRAYLTGSQFVPFRPNQDEAIWESIG